ncbi:two-component system sensor histidine kinase KdpD [Paralcaligenes ureilyticus]|uniref:histidine kinase n=1 Tax=Paralcaligenes ureilyticus TaxID=627131 RepID=A0A4V2UZD3_9BURK|nr:two-component system sensor histidine kinase KdpD [Paralcaligenes ureilyticus]TCT10388.1 two-component system sensor histidine kinase KdpD [Paralcaligenes ureilyticus]
MSPSDYPRPDPDALLAHVNEQDRQALRGKLRIYFGASAGVGKTYAMLVAARQLKSEGRDALVGIVETHGRKETAALLDGLDILPLKTVDYRDRKIEEFDIDAALARRPALILVDELAHSNAPGLRHPKRWQDVDELLNAGIDVFTTINVQHLESLNDVVGGITGIRIAETMPDTFFDAANEVVLVDIPADELLGRLKAGKVYLAPQADHAARHFFRKGNLIALRELALRRTADRVGGDVQAYRIEKSIGKVWKTDTALLACIGPYAQAEHVVRNAARLAGQLNADWHAIYIETPELQKLAPKSREQILKTLKLAHNLGAVTAVLPGNDVAQEIASYAHNHNFSKIVLGRDHTARLWRPSCSRRLARDAPDLDLIKIGSAASPESASAEKIKRQHADSVNAIPAGGAESPHWRYLWTAIACIATAMAATPMQPYLDLANIVMLFLLVEVLIAIRFGRGPAIMAAFLSVALFDFFFVPPRLSFAVGDIQYLITFAVMLAVGLITVHLTSGLRYQARVANHRERRARALYEFARELSSALETEKIVSVTQNAVQRTFHANALLLLPDDASHLQAPSPAAAHSGKTRHPELIDPGTAQWAYDQAQPAGIGTDTLPGSALFYLPLIAPMRTRGVLAIEPPNLRWIWIPEQRQHLDTFATLAAIALERVHYIDVARNALVHMESERLRNSLLAALSHDLRTPLTSLVGLSESLALSRLEPPQAELAHALHNEALRMSNLVANLLDMARIQSGSIQLNRQWQHIEEVIGSALRISHAALANHEVTTQLAPDLPLVQFDAVLIERVLCNLLENAGKYTPTGSHITIAVKTHLQFLEVSINDDGPGLPAGREEAIFEKFMRGQHESATPGVGLGLAICRAIVQAHGGEIHGAKSPQAGASLIFTLPLGTLPAMPDLD